MCALPECVPIPIVQRQTSGPRLVDDRSDEALFVAHTKGDPLSLRVLVERIEPELFGFLWRFLGDRQLAEDVFQDAFLQAHLSSESFDPDRRFKPWIFTIAGNKARDALRRSRRHHAWSLSAPLSEDGRGTGADMLDSGDEPVAASLERAEERSRVQQAVDALPGRDREVLLLTYFQRLTYAQAAEQLGIPVGTVKSRLHTAVARFSQRWRAGSGAVSQGEGR